MRYLVNRTAAPPSPPAVSYSPPSSYSDDYAYSGSDNYDWNGYTDGPSCADGTPDMRYSCNRA